MTSHRSIGGLPGVAGTPALPPAASRGVTKELEEKWGAGSGVYSELNHPVSECRFKPQLLNLNPPAAPGLRGPSPDLALLLSSHQCAEQHTQQFTHMLSAL